MLNDQYAFLLADAVEDGRPRAAAGPLRAAAGWPRVLPLALSWLSVARAGGRSERRRVGPGHRWRMRWSGLLRGQGWSVSDPGLAML